MKERKLSKSFGLILLCIAPLFYCLPDFTVIDPLPDVIGYILAAVGLTMLADVCEKVETARKRFLYLIIFGIVKLLSVLVIFGVVQNNERPTAILTIMFVFAAVEVLLLIPAYVSLFDGLIYIGSNENASAVFNSPYRKKPYRLSYSDKTKRRTVVFIIMKNLLAVFPELLALSTDVDTQHYNYNLYDDVNLLRIFAMSVATIWGIIWAVSVIRYFLAVIHDGDFIENLKEKYRREVLPNTGKFLKRKALLAFVLFAVGITMTVDIYINGNDGFNIIPDFIAGAFLCAGVAVVADKADKWRIPAIISCLGYSAISMFTSIANYRFSYKYTPQEVSRDVEVHRQWVVLVVIAVVEALIFLAAIFFVCMCLRKVIAEHTGYIPEHASAGADFKVSALHKKLNNRINVALVASAFAAAGGPFRIWSFSINFNILTDISWLIEMLLTAIMASVFLYSVYLIYDGIKDKYMLS